MISISYFYIFSQVHRLWNPAPVTVQLSRELLQIGFSVTENHYTDTSQKDKSISKNIDFFYRVRKNEMLFPSRIASWWSNYPEDFWQPLSWSVTFACSLKSSSSRCTFRRYFTHFSISSLRSIKPIQDMVFPITTSYRNPFID